MDDPAAEILELSQRLDAAYRRERATRQRLLFIHAVKGIAIGALTFTAGTASYIEDTIGVWVRPFLGSVVLLAGICLLYGLRRRNGLVWEMMGLYLMGLWDFLYAAALLGSFSLYAKHWEFLWPWDWNTDLDSLQPRILSPCAYIALGFMVWCVHLPAVLHDHRERRLVC